MLSTDKVLLGSSIFGLILVGVSVQAAILKPNIVHRDAPRPGIVAAINGIEITEEQLVGEAKLDFYELEKEKFDLKMKGVKELMADKLIVGEAKKVGMSKIDFIQKTILSGKLKISEEEYRTFIQDRHIPEVEIQQNPQIKESITLYLQKMKRQDRINQYVAKLSQTNRIEVYFQGPKALDIELGNGLTLGRKDAKVTLIEFFDYQCPFCSSAAVTVNKLKEKYGNGIRFAFDTSRLRTTPKPVWLQKPRYV